MAKYNHTIYNKDSTNNSKVKSRDLVVYICGRCSKEVDKTVTICPHCNVQLSEIRCPFCNFIGGQQYFVNDTCPRCGFKNRGISHSDLKSKVNKKNYKYNFNKGQIDQSKIKKYFTFFLFALIILIVILLVIFIVYFRIY